MSTSRLLDPPAFYKPPTWFKTTMIVFISALAVGVSLWAEGRFIGPTIFLLVYLGVYTFMQRETFEEIYKIFPVSQSNHTIMYRNIKTMIAAVGTVLFFAYSLGGDRVEAFFDGGNVYGVLVAGAILVASMGLICGYCKDDFLGRLKAEGYPLRQDEVEKVSIGLTDMVAALIVSVILSVPLWVIHFFDYLSRQFVF